MSEKAERSLELMELQPRASELRRFFKVFLARPVVIFGAIIIVILIVCAAFPEWIAPYDPIKQNLKSVLLQPNSEHLLGTDALGRDLLSRIIFGARTAVMVGIVALGGMDVVALDDLRSGRYGRMLEVFEPESFDIVDANHGPSLFEIVGLQSYATDAQLADVPAIEAPDR